MYLFIIFFPAEMKYMPGSTEYNLIPLVVAADGSVECTVGDKQLYEAQKQRKKLADTTTKLIPLPTYHFSPQHPEPDPSPPPPPPPVLSPRSEIAMLRAELEKLGGKSVPGFNFQDYTLVSPSGSGTGRSNELFQMADEDDTSAYHRELAKARRPEFMEGSSKVPIPAKTAPLKKARFSTP